MIRSITPAAILTLVSNAVAVAVAFGVNLSATQQHALLLFVGSVTTTLFAIYAAVHAQHVRAAVRLASSSAPPPAIPSTGAES